MLCSSAPNHLLFSVVQLDATTIVRLCSDATYAPGAVRTDGTVCREFVKKGTPLVKHYFHNRQKGTVPIATQCAKSGDPWVLAPGLAPGPGCCAGWPSVPGLHPPFPAVSPRSWGLLRSPDHGLHQPILCPLQQHHTQNMPG